MASEPEIVSAGRESSLVIISISQGDSWIIRHIFGRTQIHFDLAASHLTADGGCDAGFSEFAFCRATDAAEHIVGAGDSSNLGL